MVMTSLTNKKSLYSLFAATLIFSLILASVGNNLAANAVTLPTEKIPGPVIPQTPEFSNNERQQLMTDAMNVPGIKAWSDKWQYNYIDFVGTTEPTPRWERAILHLYLPANAESPKTCDIGWESIVEFNLNTHKITNSYYPTQSTECHKGVVKLGDPEQQSIESNLFIPTASAIATRNSFSAATMEDVLNTGNSIQGVIAEILTPSYNGQFSHMDGFVGQLANLRLSATPGQNYLQSGWIIASAGCTSSCGDLVQPNSKVLVWADSSVSPFNSDAHVFGWPSPPTWVNGQTLTAEVLCIGGTNYKVQAAYGTTLLAHTSNVPCTNKAQGSEITNSVFFENGNTVSSANWKNDITSTVRATNTSEKLNGSWSQWQNSKDKDQTCTGSRIDPSTVMTGNVKLGGTATWSNLGNMPVGC